MKLLVHSPRQVNSTPPHHSALVHGAESTEALQTAQPAKLASPVSSKTWEELVEGAWRTRAEAGSGPLGTRGSGRSGAESRPLRLSLVFFSSA